MEGGGPVCLHSCTLFVESTGPNAKDSGVTSVIKLKTNEWQRSWIAYLCGTMQRTLKNRTIKDIQIELHKGRASLVLMYSYGTENRALNRSERRQTKTVEMLLFKAYLCICTCRSGMQCSINITKLTSWSWVLLEKPPIVQLLKNFPVFYGTWRFITTFTRALH
jgi:hypothetical protein